MAGLKCLGGFLNSRGVYSWEGHEIELDTTRYPWGTNYEVECETVSGSPSCPTCPHRYFRLPANPPISEV
jgi:hypothetical protein